jgi:hypothetical protein
MEGAMAVPGGPGGRLGTSLEHDPRNDPSPPVPRPLPDRSRNGGRAAVALLIAALMVVVLVALL